MHADEKTAIALPWEAFALLCAAAAQTMGRALYQDDDPSVFLLLNQFLGGLLVFYYICLVGMLIFAFEHLPKLKLGAVLAWVLALFMLAQPWGAAYAGVGPLLAAYAPAYSVLLVAAHFYMWTVVVRGPEPHPLSSLAGQTVIVTGASSGIGVITAWRVAELGGNVIMACRNVPKAQPIADQIIRETGNVNVTVMELDLCSFVSVRAFVTNFLAGEKDRALDVLINNAGVLNPSVVMTKDGHEMGMQVNHLAPLAADRAAASRAATVQAQGRLQGRGRLQLHGPRRVHAVGRPRAHRSR